MTIEHLRPQLKILSEDELEPKVGVVLGTRPGIIMFSPIVRELERREVPHFLLHTGQHYSYNLDRKLFEDLELPEPDCALEAPKVALHGEQTAEMLRGCESAFVEERPRLVLVCGDANTNLAGALAARKLHIQVGHVEAGERSHDWRMPEEHNRVLIDHISEYLFVTNVKAEKNLNADNVRGRIFVTGNPIVDATRQNLEIAKRRSNVLDSLGVADSAYIVATVHREENTDQPEALLGILDGMRLVAESLGRPIVFAAHPRTQRRLREFELQEHAKAIPGLVLIDALGYLDFLALLARASLAVTDSGGVQQEACILEVPCVTLRDTTEWTETLQLGANILAGTVPQRILVAAREMADVDRGWMNPFGDGHAAERIVDAVSEILAGRDYWAEETAPREVRVP